tara:strand:+ start:532 stop:783 length:252 start_codon:yes stop_codon:yes gene_type:complete
MPQLINKKNIDGTFKSRKEIEIETNLLLNSYRRQNLLLNDRLFDLSNNIIPSKDKVIENLKDDIKKMDNEYKEYKQSNKWLKW